MVDPTEHLPLSIRDEVRHILKTHVRDGAARYQNSRDRSGLEGQKAISRLMQDTGISKANPLWIAVIDYGRHLYYGGTSGPPAMADHVRPPAVTEGHRQVLAWMASQTFREIVSAHRAVCGERVTIYFRPTDKGLVRIALHSNAPGYVGFRVHAEDEGHVLLAGSSVPTAAELHGRLCAFERWLLTVRRRSVEEQGVMAWLRRALDGDLFLPELGNGWAFLHQEWRWIADDGGGKKSDILAVHLPTGRIGIVEFKADEKDLPMAQIQVDEYAGVWDRDSRELTVFFTVLLQAMGAAYGNERMHDAVVTTDPASRFVGVASPGEGVRVWER